MGKCEIYPDRPAPLSIETPLDYKVKVQHRSDILMREQMNNVENLQDALQNILDELEKCTAAEEIAFYQDQVQGLWNELEEALVVLKVVYKLNTELQYARLELQKAVKKSNDETVNTARNRVRWLQDRMENAIANEKQMSPVRANMDSRGIRNRRQMTESTDFTQSPLALPNDDTQTSLQSVVFSEDNKPRSSTGIVKKSATSFSTFMTQQSSNVSRDSKVKIKIPEVEDEPLVKRQPPVPRKVPGAEVPGARVPGFEVPSAELPVAEVPGAQMPAVSSITESRLASLLSHAKGEASQPAVPDMEAPGDYWDSEHHRFDINPEAGLICQTNPLSYQQMGLAVPGTFVKEIKSNSELPWKTPRKLNEQRDLHQEELQRISERIHVLYERVYEAAMYSVTGHHRQRISFRGLLGFTRFAQSTGSSLSQPSLSRILKKQRTETPQSVSLPDLKEHRIGSSHSGRLIFYPKPLPYPKNLPITKTSMEKEFPRDASVFKHTEISQGVAKRIVNQGNLLAETKFTSSLFRARPLPSTGPSDHQAFLPDSTTLPNSKDSGTRKSLTFKAVADAAKAMVTFKAAGVENQWSHMKPRSGALDHTGLKWERVKDIVHHSLISPYTEERIDAARHLGALRCGDTMVTFSLKECLKHDEEERVRYEALKSLVTLGCWEEEVLAGIVRFMIDGNQDIRCDLVSTMLNAKNVMFIDKKLPSFAEVAKILSLLCMNEDPGDQLSLDAAICLGNMCIPDKHGSKKLLQALQHNSNYHFKAQALEILVRQVNHSTEEMVPFILTQLKDSPVWKYRRDAAKLLMHLGKMQQVPEYQTEDVYRECELALWNDPIKEVRQEVTRALAALNMYARACQMAEQRLEDNKEEIRGQAVISLGSLGVKNDRIIRTLVEMLELDSSDYVRILIMKMFTSLNLQNKRIIRALKEKEKGDGPLARSARTALEELGHQLAPSISKVKQVVRAGASLGSLVKTAAAIGK